MVVTPKDKTRVLKHNVNLLLGKGQGCRILDVINTSSTKNEINKNKQKQTKKIIKKIYIYKYKYINK